MTRTVFKLTSAKLTTHRNTLWTPGVWCEASGVGDLCSPGWLHCYTHPLLAVLLDPIHGDFGSSAKLWEAEADGAEKDDNGLKLGVQRLRLVREIDLPRISREERVRWAILCALEVYPSGAWKEWARGWLSRSGRAVRAAANAAAEAWAARDAAEARAGERAAAARAGAAAAEAWTARSAAEAAAWAAGAAGAGRAEEWTARSTASAAARAAAAASLDLAALAEQAIREEADCAE